MTPSFRRPLAVLGALAAVALPASPAAAHGDCTLTAPPPVAVNGTVRYNASYDCTESHPDLYVTACLERQLTPVSDWQRIVCSNGHAQDTRHVHTTAAILQDCMPLSRYRVAASGNNANYNHYHLTWSTAVGCLSAAA